MSVQGVAGIASVPTAGGLADRVKRFDVPETLTRDHLQRAQRDAQVLAAARREPRQAVGTLSPHHARPGD
jgi:hypothetical protein